MLRFSRTLVIALWTAILLLVGYCTRPARADALLGYVLEVRACALPGLCRPLPTRGELLTQAVCEARAGAILEGLKEMPREVLPIAADEGSVEVRCQPVRGDRSA